jgi:hypothetical protein
VESPTGHDHGTLQRYFTYLFVSQGSNLLLLLLEFRSSKYPNLNPILAADTTLVRFDVQKKPSTEILSSTYFSNRQTSATATPVTHMRLFSKSFPWSIDIMNTPGINCEQVWDAVYAALQEPIADSEWGLIVDNEECRKRVEKAARKRYEMIDKDSGNDNLNRSSSNSKGLKRIDWLGEKTLFKGLEKDDEFAKTRLLPGLQVCSETWVVKFGAH